MPFNLDDAEMGKFEEQSRVKNATVRVAVVSNNIDPSSVSTDTVVVSGGSMTSDLGEFNLRCNLFGIKAPNTETFTASLYDTETGVRLQKLVARSSDAGTISAKMLDTPIRSVTLKITGASGNGNYVYIIG